ncbi:MAG: hypothetical protein JNL73_24735 [Anaerolineales bacterium]|nr:hypothetical protein [Anaerolineales bacterium]
MLARPLARQLQAAGLPWTPALHDFFFFPEHELDDRIFVIADLPAQVAVLQGEAVFTFDGAAEWALDHVVTSEAVWLPTESQLRLAIEARLPDVSGPQILLMAETSGYSCTIATPEGPRTYPATSAEDAYAQALLAILGA